MAIHPGRASIVTNNYFVRNKIWHICDCIIKNVTLSQWMLIPSQTTQLFGGGSGGEERHVLQSLLPY